ncbi:hypothetical protein WMY93_000603 [Mugilogobius chulae]|uniref:Transposase n=1 Tax=Mugilogobius chulae TaxID=88201 RepID=A0AAW0QAH6_9GOBI
MLRHYRAVHSATTSAPSESIGGAVSNDGDSLHTIIYAGIVNIIIKDSRPFSLVEDVGFRELMKIVAPTYTLPSRKTEMVEAKYQEAQEENKAKVQKAVAVSLTSDMWTSESMDSYLAVTCHYIDEFNELNTTLLGIQHFPQSHPADHLADQHLRLMEEWGIRDKVRCLITDGAANMIACARRLNVRHTICIAHVINLIVRKFFNDTAGMNELRQKSRKLATYFRTSTTAKDRLMALQTQMGKQPLKMIIEATEELSAEKRVSASKVISMMNMVHHALASRALTVTHPIARLAGTPHPFRPRLENEDTVE